MDKKRKQQIEFLKKVLSRPLPLRRPYQSGGFVGTTSSPDSLKDSDLGNRRFLPVIGNGPDEIKPEMVLPGILVMPKLTSRDADELQTKIIEALRSQKHGYFIVSPAEFEYIENPLPDHVRDMADGIASNLYFGNLARMRPMIHFNGRYQESPINPGHPLDTVRQFDGVFKQLAKATHGAATAASKLFAGLGKWKSVEKNFRRIAKHYRRKTKAFKANRAVINKATPAERYGTPPWLDAMDELIKTQDINRYMDEQLDRFKKGTWKI